VPGMRLRYLKWYLPEDCLDEYVVEALRDVELAEPVRRYQAYVSAA
jgi:hypothetical protein